MPETKVIYNVVYADAPQRELDIYLPENPDSAPVLVWFHGGGMEINDKSIWEVTQFGETFSQKGFIVIAPDYRKVPEVKYPVYVEDAATALAWIFNNILEYGGDPGKIFVGGHSAGAYLASMITMAPQFLAAHGIDHLKIKGLIPVSGQMETHTRVREERNIPEEEVSIDDAAPHFYISYKLCPMLLMVADNDLPRRSEQNQNFIQAMKEAGHQDCEYIEIPNREHVSIIEDISSFEAPVTNNLLRFTQDYLK